jgi:hypothetical protein
MKYSVITLRKGESGVPTSGAFEKSFEVDLKERDVRR